MRAIVWLVLAAFAVWTPKAAFAEKRVALVIGVGSYSNLSSENQLGMAVDDARAVSATLKEQGFEVATASNVDHRAFDDLWVRFVARIEPGDIALFHFSGHGVAVSGYNYLLPSDIAGVGGSTPGAAGPLRLRNQAMSLDHLMEDMSERRPRVSLLVIDACRNNPFGAGGVPRPESPHGLAPVAPPAGSLVIYSAKPGQASFDRLNDQDHNPYSVFTRHLLPLLATPGLSFTDIARRLNGEAFRSALYAGREQQPTYYGAVKRDYYPAGEARPENPALEDAASSDAPPTPVVAFKVKGLCDQKANYRLPPGQASVDEAGGKPWPPGAETFCRARAEETDPNRALTTPKADRLPSTKLQDRFPSEPVQPDPASPATKERSSVKSLDRLLGDPAAVGQRTGQLYVRTYDSLRFWRVGAEGNEQYVPKPEKGVIIPKSNGW